MINKIKNAIRMVWPTLIIIIMASVIGVIGYHICSDPGKSISDKTNIESHYRSKPSSLAAYSLDRNDDE